MKEHFGSESKIVLQGWQHEIAEALRRQAPGWPTEDVAVWSSGRCRCWREVKELESRASWLPSLSVKSDSRKGKGSLTRGWIRLID